MLSTFFNTYFELFYQQAIQSDASLLFFLSKPRKALSLISRVSSSTGGTSPVGLLNAIWTTIFSKHYVSIAHLHAILYTTSDSALAEQLIAQIDASVSHAFPSRALAIPTDIQVLDDMLSVLEIIEICFAIMPLPFDIPCPWRVPEHSANPSLVSNAQWDRMLSWATRVMVVLSAWLAEYRPSSGLMQPTFSALLVKASGMLVALASRFPISIRRQAKYSTSVTTSLMASIAHVNRLPKFDFAPANRPTCQVEASVLSQSFHSILRVVEAGQKNLIAFSVASSRAYQQAIEDEHSSATWIFSPTITPASVLSHLWWNVGLLSAWLGCNPDCNFESEVSIRRWKLACDLLASCPINVWRNPPFASRFQVPLFMRKSISLDFNTTGSESAPAALNLLYFGMCVSRQEGV